MKWNEVTLRCQKRKQGNIMKRQRWLQNRRDEQGVVAACNKMSHDQIRKGYDQGSGCDDENKCRKHFTTKIKTLIQSQTLKGDKTYTWLPFVQLCTPNLWSTQVTTWLRWNSVQSSQVYFYSTFKTTWVDLSALQTETKENKVNRADNRGLCIRSG